MTFSSFYFEQNAEKLNGYDIYNVIEGYKFSEYPITGDLDSKGLIEGCIDFSQNSRYLITMDQDIIRPFDFGIKA